MIKRIKEFLFEYDFIWSLPLAFIGFILFPIIGQAIWGNGFAMYPPEFFHAGIYSVLLVMLFNSTVQMGIFFNFPEIYQYYLKNFNEIEPKWLKPVIFLTVYAFYFFSLIVVWKVLV